MLGWLFEISFLYFAVFFFSWPVFVLFASMGNKLVLDQSCEIVIPTFKNHINK